MNLHDVMANGILDDDTILHDGNVDDADVDTTITDDELFADELAGIVELAAAFLGSDAAALAPAFAVFTCGIYSLEELGADLWRLGAWIRGNP